MFPTPYHSEGTRITYHCITDPDILKLIILWKHNRPPDESRLDEITQHTITNGFSDGEILVFTEKENKIPQCYDGAHRLYAAKRHFPKFGIRIRVLHDATNEEITNEFIRINKSIPVPSLYFSKTEIDEHLLRIVNEFVSLLCNNNEVKQHLSNSRRPKRPNFNRDVFVERLCDYYKDTMTDVDILTITHNTISTWFSLHNRYAMGRVYNNEKQCRLTGQIKKKCEKTNIFAFSIPWELFIIPYKPSET